MKAVSLQPPSPESEPIRLVPPPEPALAPPVDLRALDAISDEAMDALPFGVIGIDGEGKIFRYNKAEARLARLDQSRVVGKNFFRQIAPCTSTDEFEGRFREYVAGSGHEALRFTYLFDFKFGAQEVEVELVPGNAPDRYYLCINRRKFHVAREQLPEGFAAPRQDELWPDEGKQGVTRDTQEQRTVAISPAFFSSLSSAWETIAPRGWPLFCDHWGGEWGKLAVVDLETEVLEERASTLRDLPMREALERVSTYLARQGWGRLTVDFSTSKSGAFVITFERNALAEAVGFSDAPRCALLSGFLRAIFSHIAARTITVREVCCEAQGHPACNFVVVGQARRGELDSAMIHAGDDLPGVLAAFRSAISHG